MLEQKPDLAKQLFFQGYNCCQSVLAAYCDHLDLDERTACLVASSFGGGMGRLREVCGAVSGMFMVAGLKYGTLPGADPAARGAHYALIQKMAQMFREQNGSIICRELLAGVPTTSGTTPEARTEGYYKKRPCPELVQCAAEIVCQVIEEEEAKRSK